MAEPGPEPMDIWCQTDFEKYDLSYKWTISNVCDRMDSGGTLETPIFSLKDKTKVKLQLDICPFTDSISTSLFPVTQPPNNIGLDFTVESTSKKKVGKSRKNVVTKGYPITIRLFSKSDLTKRESKYLVDGALTLNYVLTVTQWGTPRHKVDCIPRITVPQFSLPTELDEARKKGQLTDITLVTKTRKELKAHRSVLAVYSSVLRTRFEDRWKQNNKVDMSDMDPDVLDAMLTFLYTGNVQVVEKYAHEMLQAADKYDITNLKTVCEWYISCSLDVENAVQNLVLADTHNAPALKAVCIDFICKNQEVLKSEGWKELKASEIKKPLVTEVIEAFATILKV